jgi:hypothetical protein
MVARILGHSQCNLTTTFRYLTADVETAVEAASILERLHVEVPEPEIISVSEMVN